MCLIGFSHAMCRWPSTAGWCDKPIPSTNRPPVAAWVVRAAAAIAWGWRVQVGTTAVPSVISAVPVAAIASAPMASSNVVCASQYEAKPSDSARRASSPITARSDASSLSEPFTPIRMRASVRRVKMGVMSRLFVAIWPPEHVREHVRALRRADWAGVRWTPEQNWHVTLRFLGEAEPDVVAATLSAATLPSVVATVSSELVMLGSHSVVLPVSGVDELAESVWAATESLGTQSLSEHFRGHLTIGRAVGRDKIVHDRLDLRRRSPTSGTFEVTEIALVESTLSADGASYATVATFPTVSDGGR